MRKICWIALAMVVFSAASVSAATLTYVDLINRLTDLEALAVLPEEGEVCAQWSSWDRASKYDEATGKYVAWDANGDGGGIIRMEGGLQVLAEIDGPGCIWRTWSAAPADGKVKVYLDGAAEPVLDMPFKDYFDTTKAPFNFPALVHVVAKGWNNYVPISFNKSCKIVAENGWGNYYHFTYSKFPEGTIVPTFKPNYSPSELAALAKANDFLADDLGKDPAPVRKSRVELQIPFDVMPRSKAVVTELFGPEAITRIAVSGLDKYSVQALRNVVLNIYWEGEKEPSVSVPIGDFFGTAPGVNKYRSLPLGVTNEGCYSYWYMPFAKKAVVELQNDGNTRFSCRFDITAAALTKSVAGLGRFHAKWHRDAFLPTEPERQIDWTMLTTQGRGRFCGVMLEVWNPRGGWWGEGDEKLFVDGEKFPSTFGTGSEDYFGYAWCNPTLFQNCYHNQTISQNNTGHISVNRWHITDNVPFQKAFEGCIEKYYANARPTTYAATAYWYLAPGGDDGYAIPDADVRNGMYVGGSVFKAKGALEGEDLAVLNKPNGTLMKQPLVGNWSNDTHLFWMDAKPGDKLELALPVEKNGKYDIKLELTKACDYGIHQLYLDGIKLGNPVDLYDPQIVQTGPKSFGVCDLAAGQHKLSVEIVGTNEKAVKKYMFGLDYIKLDPVD